MGSITSFGVSVVLKWETDDPPWSGFGAYISTCPLALRPAERMPLFATTAAPTQCRSFVSTADAARCAFDIAGHSNPVLWSSRLRRYVSSNPRSLAPVVELANVRKPRP